MIKAIENRTTNTTQTSSRDVAMSMPTQSAHFTPEDLLKMPDGDQFELVNGQLVEKGMGMQSSFIGGGLFALLWNFVTQHKLGWVFPADTSFQCFPNSPTQVRKPDVSFISAARLTVAEMPKGHCRIPPDLAVEVISPNELFSDISFKVNEYLAAGVRLVWVIDPPGGRVFVYRSNGPATVLTSKDNLDGEDVLPGFQCFLGDLLKPLEETSTQ
jgi:Uma2 family endonuclease